MIQTKEQMIKCLMQENAMIQTMGQMIMIQGNQMTQTKGQMIIV